MKNQKNKILNFSSGSAKRRTLVERSTINQPQAIDSLSNYTDMKLYKLASQYAELKRIAGYKGVNVSIEYQLLSEEARQDS